MDNLTAVALKARLDAGAAPLLLDVREPWEFELCRIDGARNIPMSAIPAMLDTLDTGRETVVICHHGMRSLQVCQFLANRGFDNIYNLAGGIDAWARDIDAAVPRY